MKRALDNPHYRHAKMPRLSPSTPQPQATQNVVVPQEADFDIDECFNDNMWDEAQSLSQEVTSSNASFTSLDEPTYYPLPVYFNDPLSHVAYVPVSLAMLSSANIPDSFPVTCTIWFQKVQTPTLVNTPLPSTSNDCFSQEESNVVIEKAPKRRVKTQIKPELSVTGLPLLTIRPKVAPTTSGGKIFSNGDFIPQDVEALIPNIMEATTMTSSEIKDKCCKTMIEHGFQNVGVLEKKRHRPTVDQQYSTTPFVCRHNRQWKAASLNLNDLTGIDPTNGMHYPLTCPCEEDKWFSYTNRNGKVRNDGKRRPYCICTCGHVLDNAKVNKSGKQCPYWHCTGQMMQICNACGCAYTIEHFNKHDCKQVADTQQ